MESIWHLYILRCADDTLYTGITTDVEKRLEQHRSGKGAKYTRARRPVRLVYFEEFASKEEAMRREWRLKQMSRARKEQLIREAGCKEGKTGDGREEPGTGRGE